MFGERIWTEADRSTCPPEFLSKVLAVTIGCQSVGLVVLIYGLAALDFVAAITGVLVTQVAKLWFLDRMVLLFEAMKSRNTEYEAWEY